MRLFFCDHTGNKITPYWMVKTDADGDFIDLGMSAEQLAILIKNRSLLDSVQTILTGLEKSGHYLDKLYLSDLCPPEIDPDGKIFSAFPYRDSFWDEDDEEEVNNWELQDPKGHSYPRLYLKHNPAVLIGIVETIHYNTPELFKNLHRCRLIGISYLQVPGTDYLDAGNYFITRHLVLLRPGDEISFDAAFRNHGEHEYHPSITISYSQVLDILQSS